MLDMKRAAGIAVVVLAEVGSLPPDSWALGGSRDRSPRKALASQSAHQRPSQAWSVWGGELEFRFNEDLLRAIGLEVTGLAGARRDGEYVAFRVAHTGVLEFDAPLGSFERFTGGWLGVDGGFDLRFPAGSVSLQRFRLRPSEKDWLVLEIVDDEGAVWLGIDHLMYELQDEGTLVIHTMDVRLTPALAKRLGHPEHAGLAIADARLVSDVKTAGEVPDVPDSCANPNWPTQGYPADVWLTAMTVDFKRCRQTANPGTPCDGPLPGGTDDGEVVFAPSSTLRNSGTWSGASSPVADIPWYGKFSGIFAPYNNDQHPFLVWNLYRVSASGQLEQVGRSGVKHAFLTLNQSCEEACGNSHILGRGCGDVYSSGNNDSNGALGPRREIVPAAGLWGRCGSIYDPNCDGSPADQIPNGNYSQRLITRESQIEAGQNPGAAYFFESWYLVRDDVKIDNTMGHRQITPTFSGGAWAGSSPQVFTQGPVINRWVNPGNPGPNAANRELSIPLAVDLPAGRVDGGHARVAVKVTDVGGGQFRYDYAVMNLDYARAATDPATAEPNLRVLRNLGFGSFAVDLVGSVSVGSIAFADGDANAANDWSASVAGDRVTWTAPPGNELNWGTLFRFSFVADAGARSARSARLGIAEPGAPASHGVITLRPDNDTIFLDGFE